MLENWKYNFSSKTTSWCHVLTAHRMQEQCHLLLCPHPALGKALKPGVSPQSRGGFSFPETKHEKNKTLSIHMKRFSFKDSSKQRKHWWKHFWWQWCCWKFMLWLWSGVNTACLIIYTDSCRAQIETGVGGWCGFRFPPLPLLPLPSITQQFQIYGSQHQSQDRTLLHFFPF